jgi:hypothetical protein
MNWNFKARLKEWSLNPYNVLIGVCVIQGIWLTLLVIDAIKRYWLAALVHIGMIAFNARSIHLAKRTVFLTTWSAAQAYKEFEKQKNGNKV